MPDLTKEQVVDRLTHEVQKLDADEVLEIYESLFRKRFSAAERATTDKRPLVKEIVQHIRGGREDEELPELWSLVLPGYRNVWYNEEDELLHYDEKNSNGWGEE
jgi:hypothetical protein